MSALHLKPNPTLKDYQEYIDLMVKERGFDKETISQIFMMLTEECGELAKAARKAADIHTDENSQKFALEDEAADVFIYLLDICNYFKIDLETAFRQKEEKNSKRTWK